MAAKVVLREMTAEEQIAIADLARARTAPARLVERARIIQAAATGQAAGQIAAHLSCSRPTVYAWIRRFNERGIEGLQDQPRSGRPHTYTAEQVAEVLAAALTDPQDARPALRLLDARPAPGLPQRAQGDPDQAEPDRRDPDRRGPPLAEAGDAGSASGWTPTSPKKGGDRAALHRTARGLASSSASTRWGPTVAQELPRPGARPCRAPGSSPTARRRPAGRARQEIDYGRRRQGATSSGRSARPPARPSPTRYPSRSAANWVDFLERVEAWVPAEVEPGLRGAGQPAGAPGDRRAAVRAGAPAVGVRLPAEVRGVPEPDRAVVEGARSRWR